MEIKRWDIISKIILENRLSNGAEIGVEFGQNIKEVLSRCPDFRFIAVDCWDPNFKYQDWRKEKQSINEKQFDKLLLLFPSRIEKIKAWSWYAALKIPDSTLDLVFLDASHDYNSTRQDILSWLPKIRVGGFIGGHDYGHPKFPGVKKAVDEAFKNITLHPDYVWFAKIYGRCLHIRDRYCLGEQRNPLLAA